MLKAALRVAQTPLVAPDQAPSAGSTTHLADRSHVSLDIADCDEEREIEFGYVSLHDLVHTLESVSTHSPSRE